MSAQAACWTRSSSALSTPIEPTSWCCRCCLAHGRWIYLRSKRLGASGQTSFSLSGTHLKNRDVRVVLLSTVRHAAAMSNTVTVPPPG